MDMCYIAGVMYHLSCGIPQKWCDIAICYIAHLRYSNPVIYHKKVCYGNLLYSTWVICSAAIYPQKVVMWQHAKCHALCQLWKLQEKLCKSGCISRPRRQWLAGGRQRNASAADSLCWPDSGAPCSSSLNQPLHVAGCGPARGWTRSCHSRVASRSPAFLQQAFGCGITGMTGDSHHSGFKVATKPALGGARHSSWDNLVWNCLGKQSKSGISIVIVIDEWSCKDMQHRCSLLNLNKFDQEHFL